MTYAELRKELTREIGSLANYDKLNWTMNKQARVITTLLRRLQTDNSSTKITLTGSSYDSSALTVTVVNSNPIHKLTVLKENGQNLPFPYQLIIATTKNEIYNSDKKQCYLEVGTTNTVIYLNYAPSSADWSFDAYYVINTMPDSYKLTNTMEDLIRYYTIMTLDPTATQFVLNEYENAKGRLAVDLSNTDFSQSTKVQSQFNPLGW